MNLKWTKHKDNINNTIDDFYNYLLNQMYNNNQVIIENSQWGITELNDIIEGDWWCINIKIHTPIWEKDNDITWKKEFNLETENYSVNNLASLTELVRNILNISYDKYWNNNIYVLKGKWLKKVDIVNEIFLMQNEELNNNEDENLIEMKNNYKLNNIIKEKNNELLLKKIEEKNNKEKELKELNNKIEELKKFLLEEEKRFRKSDENQQIIIEYKEAISEYNIKMNRLKKEIKKISDVINKMKEYLIN